MRFSKNMSRMDQVIRFVAGLLLVGIAITFDLGLIVAIAVGAFGVLNIGSAFMAHCPVYSAIGISSRAQPEKSRAPNTPSRQHK